jgi:hypothetical protein
MLFGGLCLVCVAVFAGYFAFVTNRESQNTEKVVETPLDRATASGVLAHGPAIAFRNTAPGSSYGKVEVVPLDQLGGPRYVTSMVCERVYVAAGHGICLTSSSIDLFVPAYTFDSTFQRRDPVRLTGDIPSRARVSPNGRLGATTMFVGHDGYAAVGFSTRTALIDLTNGAVMTDLEQFKVTQNDQPFYNANFNFWGVTFERDNAHFYATLGSGTSTYLIHGDIAARTAQVLRENVECPSLSPDGTRIAFKKRFTVNGQVTWHLTVLDLRTMTETALAEARSVDDQVEWLDNSHILYAIARDPRAIASTDIWVAAADGSGQPRLFLANAFSPAVISPALG